MDRPIALLLTVLTGFSGLAYQVAWQRYLATLLGSHAEATAAVLGIFLGGLALGYRLFGDVTRHLVLRAGGTGNPPSLLLAYGALELAIGAYALLFPQLFAAIRALSFALPHGPGAVGFALDVGLVALLIGPATVLMGGTIPFLTQALSRSLADATRTHALVYAANTGGAFVGALAAGFYLVPELGLVRILVAMGSLNLLAGAAFVGMGLGSRPPAVAAPEATRPPAEGTGAYAWIALLVGFAMMALQTGVIRVASLSFGPSQFTFSMVVAIFVLCIALGSLGVSALPRVTPRHVVAVHWLLAGFVLLLDLALPRLPFLAYLLRGQLQDTELAFHLYQAQIFCLIGAITAPAILCSGASLPLLYHQLRRERGELGRVAGSLYSWNTLGSLLGALLGGHALLLWLDLHQVQQIAAVALLLAALLLTLQVCDLPRLRALALAPVLLLPLLFGGWDAKLLTLGLFRERGVAPDAYEGLPAFLSRHPHYAEPLLYYDDDPTTTVSVSETDVMGRRSLTLRTNGKPDGNTIGDYTTMALLGLVPAIFADEPRRAFVIGWGTGVSAGELAAVSGMERVIVSEISQGVIDAAPLFDAASQGASRNGRIRIVRSDAHRALMRLEGPFDVIVSEPSNPWVAGVENLFAREFLEAVRQRLAPGGVYGQWFHSYELDEATFQLVLRTFAAVFEHASLWYTQGGDLLLLGFESPAAATDLHRLEQRARGPFRAGLARAGVRGFAALLAHEILPLGVVHAAVQPGPVHGLYHPRLGYWAGRAFFLRRDVPVPFTGFAAAREIGARSSLLRRYAAARFDGELPDGVRAEVVRETCRHHHTYCATFLASWRHASPKAASRAGILPPDYGIEETVVDTLAGFYAEADPGAEPHDPETAARLDAMYREHFHHAAPFRAAALTGLWARCRQPAPSAQECAAGLADRRAASPLESWSEEDWLARCRQTPRVGRACREGLEAARRLEAEGSAASR